MVNEERLFQRLETLEGQVREHSVLLRETRTRLDSVEHLSRELGRLDAITSEVQRRLERLERLPEDVSEIKQDVREIRSKLDAEGRGSNTVQSMFWAILMLVLGYLLNTLPRLLGIRS